MEPICLAADGLPVRRLLHPLGHLGGGSRVEPLELYPWLTVCFVSLRCETLPQIPAGPEQLLQIDYCRTGRAGWTLAGGSSVYLGPGAHMVHSAASQAAVTLPNGDYDGLILWADLDALAAQPPELLGREGEAVAAQLQRFCQTPHLTTFAGDARTEAVFSGFYDRPGALRLAWCRLKALELLLELSRLAPGDGEALTAWQAEQVAIIRQVHDQLAQNLDTRYTIDALSHQYHLNPTTLKTVFKAVYGDSIAAHIKAHRMRRAAELLRQTQDSVAQIARAVGYENQSKFTAAFKETYHLLPTEYRRGLEWPQT